MNSPLVQSPGDASLSIEALAARLEQLEARAPANRCQLWLRAIPDDVWLGHAQSVLVQVTDPKGQAVVDTPVTLVTSWGVLAGRQGLRRQSASALTLHTDHQGMCQVQLFPALSTRLSAGQQASLVNALAGLRQADSTAAISAALRNLVRLYRRDEHQALREAVDVFYRQHGDPEWQPFPVTGAEDWIPIPVTLFAYLTPPPGQPCTGVPMSLIQLTQRNWLYRWARLFNEVLQQESTLLDSLKGVAAGTRDGGLIQADITRRIGLFVNVQKGLAGKQLGQNFASDTLSSFLQTGLDQFPADKRLALVTGLDSAGKTLRSNGALFSAMEVDRPSLGNRVGALDAEQLGNLQDRIGKLETSTITRDQLDTAENRLSERLRDALTQTLDSRIEETMTGMLGQLGIADMKNQLSNLERQHGRLSGQLSDLSGKLKDKATVNQLTELSSALQSQLKDLSATTGKLETWAQNVSRELDLKANLTTFEHLDERVNRLGKDLSRQLAGIDTRFDRKVDVQVFDDLKSAHDLTQRDLANLGRTVDQKADVARVDRIDNDLSKLQDANKTQDGRLGRLDQQLADRATLADLAKFNQQVIDLQRDHSQLNQKVTGFDQQLGRKVDASQLNALNTQLRNLQTQNNNLNTQVTQLNGQMANKADVSQVNALNTEVRQLKTTSANLDSRLNTININHPIIRR